MERKGLLKKANEAKVKPLAAGPGKLSGISNKVFDIIKLILGICLLPFVYSSTVAFLNQFSDISALAQNAFWAGVISFLLVYLFIWELELVYNSSHKLLEIIFSFFQPLVKVAPYLLPIYGIVLFILYLLLALFIKSDWLIQCVMFLFGFTTVLHLVFSAKAIRSKKGDILKSNYIFGFSFIYIVNLGLIAFFLNVIFKEFSFVDFFNSAYFIASDIFYAVFHQLFAV
ncbi:MAG: hypothetical protein NTW13_01010 [Candidatus Omnitrophica bacterium]|nr:hypothetical protein [Candidatus Omnitrophota bacterium]